MPSCFKLSCLGRLRLGSARSRDSDSQLDGPASSIARSETGLSLRKRLQRRPPREPMFVRQGAARLDLLRIRHHAEPWPALMSENRVFPLAVAADSHGLRTDQLFRREAGPLRAARDKMIPDRLANAARRLLGRGDRDQKRRAWFVRQLAQQLDTSLSSFVYDMSALEQYHAVKPLMDGMEPQQIVIAVEMAKETAIEMGWVQDMRRPVNEASRALSKFKRHGLLSSQETKRAMELLFPTEYDRAERNAAFCLGTLDLQDRRAVLRIAFAAAEVSAEEYQRRSENRAQLLQARRQLVHLRHDGLLRPEQREILAALLRSMQPWDLSRSASEWMGLAAHEAGLSPRRSRALQAALRRRSERE